MLSMPLLKATGSLLIVSAAAAPFQQQPYKHVVALSIDGMHGSDVEKYLAVRPNSAIASLLATGYEYQNAYTSAVSKFFQCVFKVDS